MADTIYEYLMSKNNRRVKKMAKNESVCTFVMALVDGLDTYAKAKGMTFEDVKITNKIISSDGVLNARIGF